MQKMLEYHRAAKRYPVRDKLKFWLGKTFLSIKFKVNYFPKNFVRSRFLSFVHEIVDLRAREMISLSKQKYLDALCVYFWATTPIIINLLTFGTLTLLGKPMTAATTFASVALLNMLIGPLNAFPWVLNGLVEAWISLKRVQVYLDVSAGKKKNVLF